MRTLLIGIFLVIFFIIDIPILCVQWIISKFNQHHADVIQLRIVQFAFRLVCFISGVKLEVIGQENVPKDEAVMYVANHRGFFDIVVTYMLCPGLTGYISKAAIRKVPVLGLIMKRLYCLFINRDDIKQGMQVILTAIDQVKRGISVCIFPEGTRHKDKDNPSSMLRFKEGSFKIAIKSGCKIVPMAIYGTDNCLENHVPWIKSSKVVLKYGEPIDPKNFTKDEQKKIGAYTQSVVQEMLYEICPPNN